MKRIITLLSIYNLIAVGCLIVGGLGEKDLYRQLLYILFFIPTEAYFLLEIARRLYGSKRWFLKKRYNLAHKILSYYSFGFVHILLFALIKNISNISEFIFILLLSPLEIYFLLTIMNIIMKGRGITYGYQGPKLLPATTESILIEEYIDSDEVKEAERRKFIKLLFGAGLGVVLVGLLNPKKASAAFFGSVPGPGSVTLKDTTGAKIDPAIAQPLDGYSISNYIDTGAYPHYFGFVNKNGAWYMIKDTGDADGTFLYSKGGSGYDWSGRAGLTYASFDTTF